METTIQNLVAVAVGNVALTERLSVINKYKKLREKTGDYYATGNIVAKGILEEVKASGQEPTKAQTATVYTYAECLVANAALSLQVPQEVVIEDSTYTVSSELFIGRPQPNPLTGLIEPLTIQNIIFKG